MKRFLLSMLALVCMTAFGQELNVVKHQVEDAKALKALADGDIVMLSSTDERTPGHYFEPASLHKNEEPTQDNLLVVKNPSWNEETKTLSCRLQQKSSGKYLTKTLGVLGNANEAFTFNILFRAPSNQDNAIPYLDTYMTVSLSDGEGNYLNSQGDSDDKPCAWKNGTANWSVWYLHKVDRYFAVFKDGGQYYLMTQGKTAYKKSEYDYYYGTQLTNAAGNEDFDVYLRKDPTEDCVWEVTFGEGAQNVAVQSVYNGHYLATDKKSDYGHGTYQSVPEIHWMDLKNPTLAVDGYVDEASFILFSDMYSGVYVYPYGKEDGQNMGTGMYFSNEQVNATYGMIYRFIDIESGLPVAFPAAPEEPTPAIDLFQAFISKIVIPTFRQGDEPGCVKDYDHAIEIIKQLSELQELLDNPDLDPDDEDYWRAMLRKAKELADELENIEYIPVTTGYYRFVSSFPDWETIQDVEKAMAGANEVNGDGEVINKVAAWFTLDEGEPIVDEEGNPTGEVSGLNQIWRVEEGEDGHLYVFNLYNNMYFKGALGQSGRAYMGATPQWVEFINTGSGDFNLKVLNQGYPLHCGGHESGAGEKGFVVGWNGGSGTCSAWFVRPVSEEEVFAKWGEDVLDYGKRTAELYTLIGEAETAIATSKVIVTSYDGQLITDASQISSPKTEKIEGYIAALIDENTSTYWHSIWTEGSIAFGSEAQLEHHLQFDLREAYNKVYMKYACRLKVNDDKPTSFEIQASNDAEDGYVVVDTIKSVGTADNVYYYYPIEMDEAYRYLRVRALSSSNPYLQRGYWHAAEMNFYTEEKRSPDLYAKTGEIGEALTAAIAAAKQVNRVSNEDIAALRAALDAFLEAYTDPTVLRQAVADATELVAVRGVGNDVGQRNSATAFSTLETTFQASKTFLDVDLATCTKEAIVAQTNALTSAVEAWLAIEPNKVQTGVWYHIQCPETAFRGVRYEPIVLKGIYENGMVLRGARLAMGVANEDDATLSEAKMYVVPTSFIEAEEVDLNGDNYGYAYTDECTQWRFFDAGDGAYYIQNRATGMFLPAPGTQKPGELIAAYVPGKFTPVYYNGAVVNLIAECVDEDGADAETSLSIKSNDAVLIAYPNRADATIKNGASWEIVKVEDVKGSYVQTLNFNLDGLNVRGLTLPYAIDPTTVADNDEANIDFITSIVGIDSEQGALCCNNAKELIPAGTPMFIFTGDNDVEPTFFRVAMKDDLSWEVNNSGDLRGTLVAGVKIPSGAGVPGMVSTEDNYMEGAWGAIKTTGDDTIAKAGDAWLVNAAHAEIDADDADCDQYLVLDQTEGKLLDVISIVKDDNTGKVTVTYNLNGQRVSANAKGLLIIGGKKVFIK